MGSVEEDVDHGIPNRTFRCAIVIWERIYTKVRRQLSSLGGSMLENHRNSVCCNYKHSIPYANSTPGGERFLTVSA